MLNVVFTSLEPDKKHHLQNPHHRYTKSRDKKTNIFALIKKNEDDR